MKKLTKLAIVSGLSLSAATALAAGQPQDKSPQHGKQTPPQMTDEQMDAVTGGTKPDILPTKPAAKKAPAKKHAGMTDTQMDQIVAGAPPAGKATSSNKDFGTAHKPNRRVEIPTVGTPL